MSKKSVNKVTLIGHLGIEPEVRATHDGTAVVTLSVATTETWKNKSSRTPQERTEWHRVVMFGKVAKVVGEYLHKGSLIYLEGRLHTRKYVDRDGHDRWVNEIISKEMRMLGDPGQNGGPVENNSCVRAPSPDAGTDYDDDIPF